MDDLASDLGMSKKTFYAHFRNKVSLVEAVLRDKADSVEADLERIVDQPEIPFLEALRALLACLQEHLSEIQPSFLRDIRRDAPEVFAVVEKRRAILIERCFTRLLNAGRRAGLVRDDVPVRLFIEILLAATQAVMNPRKMDELKLTPKRGYSAILDVMLHGVLTTEGRAEA